MSTAQPTAPLLGRDAEIGRLRALLDAAAAGESGALVVRGEPGIGKSTLLAHLAATAAAEGATIVRGTGVEAEAELPFSGLSLLLRPTMRELDGLPAPQRDALGAAMGLAVGEPPDPMFVGLAVLTLLDVFAGQGRGGPLLCVIDDAQWLDRPTAQALTFAARRLGAEGVVMLFAARDGEGAFPAPGLPEMRLSGLDAQAAARLLDADVRPDVRARVLAEAQGNPLALLELPVAFRDGNPGNVGALPLTGRLTLAFHGQVSRLPRATQTLLLVAAADDTGDTGVVLRAARALGGEATDVEPAETAGLVDLTTDEFTFRHPLIRAAVVQRAPLAARIEAHRALADALDTPDHADRRAWHLAAAATEPDESVAAELARTADRARDRSGLGAAARAYERAARLTPEREGRRRRLLLAAEAALGAGEIDWARGLAEEAIRGLPVADAPLDHARATYVRGSAEFGRGAYTVAHPLMTDAAQLAAEQGEFETAAGMLLPTLHCAWYVGEGAALDTVSRLEALSLPEAHPLTPLVALIADAFRPLPPAGKPVAVPLRLGHAIARSEAAGRVDARGLRMACAVSLVLGQDGDAHDLAVRLSDGLRAQGELGSMLPIAFFKAETEVFLGRHDDARQTTLEGLAIARDSGQRQWTSQLESVLAILAALEGDVPRCREHADEALGAGVGGDAAPGAPWAHWALGLLELGSGGPEAALDYFELLMGPTSRHHIGATRAIPDLVEAAMRCGRPDRAEPHVDRFAQWARRAQQPWGDALLLRCRALLVGADASAEGYFEEALTLHPRTARPLEQARTELLFGEWLRRGRRKAQAAPRLRAALELFERHGARGWADRARGELDAAGGRVSPEAAPAAGAAAVLTPQELAIARLAAQGLSNRDIAAQLFLSPRTVGHHLYKAYPKLGITSRAELSSLEGLHPS